MAATRHAGNALVDHDYCAANPVTVVENQTDDLTELLAMDTSELDNLLDGCDWLLDGMNTQSLMSGLPLAEDDPLLQALSQAMPKDELLSSLAVNGAFDGMGNEEMDEDDDGYGSRESDASSPRSALSPFSDTGSLGSGTTHLPASPSDGCMSSPSNDLGFNFDSTGGLLNFGAALPPTAQELQQLLACQNAVSGLNAGAVNMAVNNLPDLSTFLATANATTMAVPASAVLSSVPAAAAVSMPTPTTASTAEQRVPVGCATSVLVTGDLKAGKTPSTVAGKTESRADVHAEQADKRLSGPTAFMANSVCWKHGHLNLTQEEKDVLKSEGLPIPTSLPLSSEEEKAIKLARRKIKNKISAQESRRKRKEYIDNLEKRLTDSDGVNKRLIQRVAELETKNSTLQQETSSLRKQMAAIRASVAQVSTSHASVLVFAVIFAFVFPCCTNISFSTSVWSSKAEAPALLMGEAHIRTEPMKAAAAAEPNYDYSSQNFRSRTLMSLSAYPMSLESNQSTASSDDVLDQLMDEYEPHPATLLAPRMTATVVQDRTVNVTRSITIVVERRKMPVNVSSGGPFLT